MHTFKFTLLAVLSYVAMIGATPLGSRDPPRYAPLSTARGGSDSIENISPAQTAPPILRLLSAPGSAPTTLCSQSARSVSSILMSQSARESAMSALTSRPANPTTATSKSFRQFRQSTLPYLVVALFEDTIRFG